MTNEEKQVLLKDLCTRLPYGVKINVPHHYEDEDGIITLDAFWLYDIQNGRKEIKPYLYPMSYMTGEERKEYNEYLFHGASIGLMSNTETAYELIDWLNAHHFDYRCLIEKGLALEAPEDMYKVE